MLPEIFLFDGLNPPMYSVGGTVYGFAGQNFKLDNTGTGDSIVLSYTGNSNQPFQFNRSMHTDDAYNVIIVDYPYNPSQLCQLNQGSGTIGNSNINNVAIQCINAYRVSGNLQGGDGLVGSGLSLTDNGGDLLPVLAGSTSFTFHTPASLVDYGVSGSTVSVIAQPTYPWQKCYFGTPGSYTTTTGPNIVNDTTLSTALTCVTDSYNVYATISGLNYNGLGVTIDGSPYTYNTSATSTAIVSVKSGQPYGIFITAQPTGQNCSIFGGGDGTTTFVEGTDVVARISCSTNTYSAGGAISNLSGSGLIVQIGGVLYSGGSPYVQGVTVSPGSSAYIATGGLNYGDTITSATILQQPTGPNQYCTFQGGVTTYNPSVTVSGGVTLLPITCITNSIGGSLTGYNAPSVGLTITYTGLSSGTQSISPASGSANWTMAGPTTPGESYSLSVSDAYNPGLVCDIGGSTSVSGTILTSKTIQNISCSSMSSANPPTISGPDLNANVTMTPGLTGDRICYTIDGSTPGCSLTGGGSHNSTGDYCAIGSIEYTAPVAIGSTTSFIAISCDASSAIDESTSTSYLATINGSAAMPTFSQAPGVYNNDVSVGLNSATPGAVIYYSTNGTTPSCSGPGTPVANGTVVTVNGSITVAGVATLKAVACAPGYTGSTVASATYTLQVAAPILTLDPTTGIVSMSDPGTNGAAIHYTSTSGGSTPGCASTAYTASFAYPYTGTSPSSGFTIDAIGCKSGYLDSASSSLHASAPSVTISNLSNNQTVGTGFIVGTASDDLLNISNVWISLDGGALQAATIVSGSGSSSVTWKFKIPTGPGGWASGTMHTIAVYGQNIVGMTSATTTISVRKGMNRDINGDGFGDMVVGGDGNLSSSISGRVFVFYSSGSAGVTATGSSMANAVLTGQSLGDSFGGAVTIGDVNGDGYADVVVGARGYASNQGRAYVFYSSGSSGITSTSAASASLILSGTGGTDNFGASVAVGDVNGDGYGDVFVGASTGFGNGAVFIYQSSGSSPITSAYSSTLQSGVPAAFGQSVAVGDVNGDGYGDLVIGAPGDSSGMGKVYVYQSSGSSGISGTIAVTIPGENANDHFGQSVAIGDVNGDGLGDLVVGAYYYLSGSYTGRVYIFSGQTLNGGGSLNPTTAGTIITGDVPSSYFGATVAVGDVNGDGYQDVAVGAPANGGMGSGVVYLFSGASVFSGSISAASANVRITAVSPLGGLGSAVSIGDVNGDGFGDILASACMVTGKAFLFLSSGAPGVTATSSSSANTTIADTTSYQYFGRAMY